MRKIIGSVVVGAILCALTPLAYANDAYYLNENNEIEYYDCVRTIDRNPSRTCSRPFTEEEFDVVPSVGSFSKYKDGLTRITDIEDQNKYRFAIQFGVQQGYFTLFRGNRFLPDHKVTREEFVEILMDVLGVNVPSYTRTDCFADLRLVNRRRSLTTQERRKKKVCHAQSEGWLDQNLRFMPTKHINKAAAAKILVSAYDFPGGYTNLRDNYFDDVSRGTWFARFVNAGRAHNIFPDKRRFNPGAVLTRKEAALWFYNLQRAMRSPEPQDVQIQDVKQYTESTLTQMISESRMKYGKSQLKFDEKLYSLALSHSQSMERNNSLTHGNLRNYQQYLGRDYMALGENIAVYKITGSSDVSQMVERIHAGMMNEPRGQLNHRANILGESYAFTYFAVAAYEDKEDGRVWITQVFAKKRPGK